jgi:hypothetical protein
MKRAYVMSGLPNYAPGTLGHSVNVTLETFYRLFMQKYSIAVRKSKNKTYQIAGNGSFIIAIRITGGIGDHIIAARYLRDLIKTVGSFSFDLFSSKPEVARWLFSDISGFHRCYEENYMWTVNYRDYPLAVWITQFLIFYVSDAQWKAIVNHLPKIIAVINSSENVRTDIEPFIAQHPRLDGFFSQYVTFKGMKRHNYLQTMSGVTYGGEILPIQSDAEALTRFGLGQQLYITVHNGFDAEFRIHKGEVLQGSTKVYPHFDKLVGHLKKRYPEIKIVQLGVETSNPILNVDIDLLSKTSMSETAMIIKNSLLHIDNEGGLVHLATALDTKCCVLFGPTAFDYYAYENNFNVRPNFCGGCWWTTTDWMQHCPRGLGRPECLHSIQPEEVVDLVSKYIKEKLLSRETITAFLPASRGVVAAE